jgi:hypothetical protein
MLQMKEAKCCKLLSSGWQLIVAVGFQKVYLQNADTRVVVNG